MQLYKSREFGDLFGDTFKFLGKYGKHYATNYLIINGVATVISLMTMIPLLSMFFNLSNFEIKAGGDFKYILTENTSLFFSLMAFMFITGILLSVITYSFTPIYFKLFEQKGGANFTTYEIIKNIKTHYFKGLKAIFGIFILALLLSIPVLIAVVLVACTFVGVFIPLAAFMMLLIFTFYQYYANKENRFFASFGYAWDLVSLKFWHTVGNVAVIILIAIIVQQMFTLIIEKLLSLQTNPEVILQTGDFNLGADFWSGMLISGLFSIIIQFIIGMVINTNLAIAFYSLKAEKENISSENDIEEIGRAI